jgi:hypothetical protein
VRLGRLGGPVKTAEQVGADGGQQRTPLAPCLALRYRPPCSTYLDPGSCLVNAHPPGNAPNKSDCLRAVAHSNAKVFE